MTASERTYKRIAAVGLIAICLGILIFSLVASESHNPSAQSVADTLNPQPTDSVAYALTHNPGSSAHKATILSEVCRLKAQGLVESWIQIPGHPYQSNVVDYLDTEAGPGMDYPKLLTIVHDDYTFGCPS